MPKADPEPPMRWPTPAMLGHLEVFVFQGAQGAQGAEFGHAPGVQHIDTVVVTEGVDHGGRTC